MKELDFLPASFHAAIRRRRRNRRNVLYCLAVATLLAVLHGMTASEIRSAQAALTAVREGTSLRDTQRARLGALKQTRSALQMKADLLNQLLDDAPLDAVIGEINRLMGPTTALRLLSVQTAPPVENPDKANKARTDLVHERGRTEGVLEGVAANDVEVGMFYGRLSSCPLFDEVRLNYSREVQRSSRSMREFQLKFAIRRVSLGEPEGVRTTPESSAGHEDVVPATQAGI